MATMAISQRRTVGASKAGAAMWAAQAVLALVFLFAGGMKLAMPLELLAEMSPLPALFMKFIAVCEIAGAAGLILPGLFRIRNGLTPLAAAGLVVIMIGATISTLAVGMGLMALMPLLVGLLAASVAYGRRRG
jgi:DoxX-like protein